MFLRRNRAINGAPQPEQTQAVDAKAQRSARKLAPNFPLDGSAEDWRFQPEMETCEGINDHHYEAGLRDGGPYDTSYEDKIPYVGAPVPSSTDRKLREP